MRPVIIHTASFYNFTTTLIREPMPFDDATRFLDFCDLVENLVLSDQVYAWNVGAYDFEWESGYYTVPKNRPSIHPYEVFHTLEYVDICPFFHSITDSQLIKQLSALEIKQAFDGRFGELKHELTLSVALSMYVQAYNGQLGEVTVREPAILGDLLPDLVSFSDSRFAVRKDPLIIQAIDRLNHSFKDELKVATMPNITPVVIPPVVAVLLERLPDNCVDPYTVLREILDLRDELLPVRRRFSELEDIVYDDSAPIKDLREVQRAIEIDSESFQRSVSTLASDSAVFRWFVDNLSFLCNALVHQGIALEDLVNLLADIIPTIERRVRVRTPSRLLWMARDAHRMKGYKTLAKRKLGMEL